MTIATDREGPVERLAGGLIVSCQALLGDPLDSVDALVALARSAEIGGASGLRVASPAVVAAVRQGSELPIIGITKHPDRSRAYITPTLEDAKALAEAGASIIAVDATALGRPGGVDASSFIRRVLAETGLPVMADVSTCDEGRQALDAGAALVATTLSGYTPYSSRLDGPDIDLVDKLSREGRVVAEGRIHSPEQLAAAFAAGAYSVVVGRAITRPQDITSWYVARTPKARTAPSRVLALGTHRGGRPLSTGTSGPRGYLLGVDGGQSALRAVIVAPDGSIYGRGVAEPATTVLAPGGRAQLTKSLRRAISSAMGSDPVPIEAAFLGLSGVVAGGRIEAETLEAAADAFTAGHTAVGSDLGAARAGAFSLEPGIAVIAGSGSAVIGEDASGKVARAGGWGYLFGDEAGAFGLGRQMIKSLLREHDAGRDDSELSRRVAGALALPDVASAPRALYAGELTRQRVAELAVLVEGAAAEADERASAIFNAAAEIVADQVQQVVGRLHFPEGAIPWAGVGGVFDGGLALAGRLDAILARRRPGRFVRVEAAFEPAVGAALIAADLRDPAHAKSLAALLRGRVSSGNRIQQPRAGSGGGVSSQP